MMKVDIAIECARLQHRLTLPPLEVEGSWSHTFGATSIPYKMGMCQPYFNKGSSSNTGGDILDEILSVAQAQQDLIQTDFEYNTPSMIGGFMSHGDPMNQQKESSLNPLMDNSSWEDSNLNRMVNFSDLVVFQDTNLDKVNITNFLNSNPFIHSFLKEVFICYF